jgi:anthranilate phosphoribosyltransferase
VLLNAAAALWVAGAADGLAAGLSLARRSLDEGAAARKLALLAAASRSAP